MSSKHIPCRQREGDMVPIDEGTRRSDRAERLHPTLASARLSVSGATAGRGWARPQRRPGRVQGS